MNVAQPRQVSVFDVDPAVRDSLPQQTLHRNSHGSAGLPGAHHIDVADAGERIPLRTSAEHVVAQGEVAENSLDGVGGLQSRLENTEGVLSKRRLHEGLVENG